MQLDCKQSSLDSSTKEEEFITDVRNGVARLQLEFLERFSVLFGVVELYNRHVVMDSQFDKDLLPKPVHYTIH